MPTAALENWAERMTCGSARRNGLDVGIAMLRAAPATGGRRVCRTRAIRFACARASLRESGNDVMETTNGTHAADASVLIHEQSSWALESNTSEPFGRDQCVPSRDLRAVGTVRDV